LPSKACPRESGGAGRESVPLGPAFRRLDRDRTARALDRWPATARSDQQTRRRGSSAVAGARRHRGDPASQTRPRHPVAVGIAGAQAEEGSGAGAGQQNGADDVGDDDQRRGLPAPRGGAGGGLSRLET